MRPVDVAVLAYAAASGAVIAVGAPEVAGWAWLLAGRGILAAAILALARAARSGPGPWTSRLRELYPLAVLAPFFWEAPRFAGALHAAPWAFEGPLRAWDRALFGGPSIPETFGLPPAAAELLWLLYFAYYPIVGVGLLLAWAAQAPPRIEPGARLLRPSPAWEPVLTAAVLGFLGAYVLFPLFPARAPVHALTGVAPAGHGVFGALVGWIQAWGGVTGNAFPSAHVSAAWAIALSLARFRPRAGRALAILTAGMTAACVWSPYHWAADAAGGLVVGLAAGLALRLFDRRHAVSCQRSH